MALTTAQRSAAVAVLDAYITIPRKVDGKYKQVLPSSPDGKHTVERHEYVGSLGVGYSRILTTTDSGIVHTYQDHQGPEPYRKSGWASYKLSEAMGV